MLQDGGSGIEFKEESKVGSFTMYKSKTPTGDDGPAFCVVSSSLVVGSDKGKALESVLRRDKKAQFSTSFQKIIDKADFSHTDRLRHRSQGRGQEGEEIGPNSA